MTKEDLKIIIQSAYNWGRDNGSGRSEKNLNDFMERKLIQNVLEETNKDQCEHDYGSGTGTGWYVCRKCGDSY